MRQGLGRVGQELGRVGQDTGGGCGESWGRVRQAPEKGAAGPVEEGVAGPEGGKLVPGRELSPPAEIATARSLQVPSVSGRQVFLTSHSSL